MLDYKLMQDEGVVCIHPESPLLARDFAEMNEMLNRYLSHHKQLKGLVINADDPLGWEEFSDWVSHLSFTRDYPQQELRIATLSDKPLSQASTPISNHFVGAQVKHFTSHEGLQALSWIEQQTLQ